MTQIEGRKADHINICLNNDVTPGRRYWDDIRLIHNALPEVDYDEIDTSADVLGKRLEFPFIVNAITGGFEGAKKINENLAKACSELGIGMGVGSQRAAIEGVETESYSVIRNYDIPLVIGNVGAPQLIDQKDRKAFTADDIAKAMDIIDADFMAVHLNYLQEAVQPEGDMRSRGCFDAIRELARQLPLIVKETGAGISPGIAKVLSTIGVEAIDIGGMGGTSFSMIEMHRAIDSNNPMKAEIGNTFYDWGIPATVSLATIESEVPVISSGGILSGLDIARSIAMGAVCAAGSNIILKEATESAEAVMEMLKLLKEEYKVAMMLTGSSTTEELSQADYVIIGETRKWME